MAATGSRTVSHGHRDAAQADGEFLVVDAVALATHLVELLHKALDKYLTNC
jgi:hypothetical protein